MIGNFGRVRANISRNKLVSPAPMWRCVRVLAAGASTLLTVLFTGVVAAQTFTTSQGPPPEVVPQVGELGMPHFTIPSGTTNPYGASVGGGPTDAGTGTDTQAMSDAASGIGGIGGDTGTTISAADVLSTMMNQPWGISAINNAQALGVNPTAVAATCVLESGCQVAGSGGTSSATGAFQMMPATYYSMINSALQQNPSLASSVVPGTAGMSDPATESIAASEYLLQAAQTLQANGISNPTVLDVRGYYNFGPVNGANLANAQDSDLMGNVLAGLSASTLAENGISSGETVGQWRASVSAKIGNAAALSVLSV